jgi:uncharacterized protein DUF2865
MSFLFRRAAGTSLAVSFAVYASAVLVVGLATGHAVQRLGAFVLGELQPVASPVAHGREQSPAPEVAHSAPVVRRVANMTQLQGLWSPQSRPRNRPAAGLQFGGSSRGPSRLPWGFDDDDDGDRPAAAETYRTVCVRLCDGYYFPINFAVPQDRLQRDSSVCASRCGAQGRLFVYRNPGGSVEEMQDLSGRPYSQLKTAFLYRSEYVASCKCQPDPWEAASRERHRGYALAQAARQGNLAAAKELRALQEKLRQTASAPDPAKPDAGSSPSLEKAAEVARREDGTLMGLGSGETQKARPDPKPQPTARRSDSDWIKRIFGSGFGH